MDGVAIETVVESMRPAPSLRGHLTFHLKHEVLHLELLSRLFEQLDQAVLVGWIQQESTGLNDKSIRGTTHPPTTPSRSAYDHKDITAALKSSFGWP